MRTSWASLAVLTLWLSIKAPVGIRFHGLIKRVGKRYHYCLTDFGHQVAAPALKLREMVIILNLAFNLPV